MHQNCCRLRGSTPDTFGGAHSAPKTLKLIWVGMEIWWHTTTCIVNSLRLTTRLKSLLTETLSYLNNWYSQIWDMGKIRGFNVIFRLTVVINILVFIFFAREDLRVWWSDGFVGSSNQLDSYNVACDVFDGSHFISIHWIGHPHLTTAIHANEVRLKNEVYDQWCT